MSNNAMDVLAISETNIPIAQAIVASPEVQPETQEDNKFQKAIALWRNIDLTSLISQIDASASEVVANQRDALVERKDVASRTKEFRKLDDTGKLAEFKTLLKAYQSFVDLLTNHNKTSSSAFIQLYTPLSEAPDPFPLLEASVESLITTEETLPRLTTENEELHRRVNRLTAQLDTAEQKLQSEIKARKEAEEGTGSRIQAIEASWARVVEEKESNWTAKERALEEKLENQERLLKELKASYEVSERMGHENEERDAAMSKAASAELELMSSDLEKTSARLSEMEARNEELRVELAKATSQHLSSATDEAVITRLQTENSGLLRKLESARFERDAEKGEWGGKFGQIERQRTSVTNENRDLKAKLQRYSDYDELKRELNMLRSIELSADDETQSNDYHTNDDLVDTEKESLEQLLLSRNKKLSSELTVLRVAHRELDQQLETLQAQLSGTTEELEKSQMLATTLENDLLRVQEEAADALPSSGMSVAGTYISRYPTSSRRGRSSPTSSIISGFDSQSRMGSTTLEALRSGEPVGGGSGILPMIQAQRDRFKQKNKQLEDELQKIYATVTSLRQEVASLQKDNLGLYEKTRYISAYSRGTNASSSTAYSQAPTHVSVHSIADEDTDDRWKSQYEANMSPFNAFRGREATRAYKKMTFPERTIFTLTRMVLATRTSRNLFGIYLCGLHLLVLCMLWLSASVGSSGSHVEKAASAAMIDRLGTAANRNNSP